MLPHQFFKLLSDETRVRCLMLIVRQECLSVGELTQALQESQPKISRHLAQLRSSGILTDVRQGQWVFYSINPELPEWCAEVFKQTLAENEDFIEENVERLCRIEDRPQRPGACC